MKFVGAATASVAVRTIGVMNFMLLYDLVASLCYCGLVCMFDRSRIVLWYEFRYGLQEKGRQGSYIDKPLLLTRHKGL